MAAYANRGLGRGRVRRAGPGPLAAAMGAFAVATATALILSGCSTSATDAVKAAAAPDIPQTQTMPEADRIAIAVRDRLAIIPEIAWAKYDKRSAVDDAEFDDAETAAFMKAATSRGVPKEIAKETIAVQLAESATIQVSLIQQWGTGVAPIPTEPVQNLVRNLKPQLLSADTALANALGDLAAVGVPADLAQQLAASADGLAASLPTGVTRTQLIDSLAPIGKWQPPAPAKKPMKKTKGKKRMAGKSMRNAQHR